MKYAAVRGPPVNIIIGRRGVNDVPLVLKIVEIPRQDRRKTPSQYVMLPCGNGFKGREKYKESQNFTIFIIPLKSTPRQTTMQSEINYFG